MAKLANLARMVTTTEGTGSVTLAAAVAGFLTFEQAGIVDVDLVSYSIVNGEQTEVGRGIWTAATKTLSRQVLRSTNNNAAINLVGSSDVFVTALAEDFADVLAAANAVTAQHANRTDNPHGVTAAQIGAVPTSRTVNAKPLSSNITLTAADVGAVPTGNDAIGFSQLADIATQRILGRDTSGTGDIEALTASQVRTMLGALTSSDFTSVKASNGYQRLPSGVIIQWGVFVVAASGKNTITYPMAFPTTSVATLPVTSNNNDTILITTTVTVASRFSFSTFCNYFQNGTLGLGGGAGVTWAAIGY